MGYSDELSFDNLPKAIGKLMVEVNEIKRMLISNRPREEPINKKLSTNKALLFFELKGCPMSKSKFYKLSAQNKLPSYKFGNRLVFDEGDLINWLESQTKVVMKTNLESIKSISNSARNKLTKSN